MGGCILIDPVCFFVGHPLAAKNYSCGARLVNRAGERSITKRSDTVPSGYRILYPFNDESRIAAKQQPHLFSSGLSENSDAVRTNSDVAGKY